MKVTDEIQSEKIVQQQAENTDDLFFAMLNGKTVSETISTSRGEFLIKFPKPRDIDHASILMAHRRMGAPSRTLDAESENNLYKTSMLDVVVESGPPWFEKAKVKNADFGWRDVPDSDFIDEVYELAHSFRLDVQKKLKPAAKQTAGTDANESVQEAMGDGLFSGVASTAQ